jgi:PAS domain S-box-containing protein
VHDNSSGSPADTRLLLRLEHAVGTLVADSTTGALQLYALVATIGTALGWPFGAVWVPSSLSELTCATTWQAGDPLGLSAFAEATMATVLPLGVGLPGRVWRSRRAEWVRDVRDDTNFPRAEAAVRSGLAAAVCFPIEHAGGIQGVVEFFTTEPLDPSPEVVSTLTSIGRRAGEALRHKDIDDRVRRSEARLRAVVESALDCVVIADSGGRVLEFNPAACETFGYSRADAVGRELADLIIPSRLRAEHRAGWVRYMRTQHPRILDRRIETTGARSDGSEFPVELTVTRIAVDGEPVFAAYLRDLTVRQAAEQELKASRRRVIEAAVAERQRLERDLHDGAQQHLISLGLHLARARGILPHQPDRAAAIVDDAIARLDEAAVELRNLARGIHPSSLTLYGLATALADMARHCPVELTLGELPTQRFDASVEATAYFVVNEALTNVARHAPDSRAHVAISPDEGWLRVVIADDGPGGASLSPSAAGGTGLRGLADRVGLLDGIFEVDSPVDGGTTIRAHLPLQR